MKFDIKNVIGVEYEKIFTTKTSPNYYMILKNGKMITEKKYLVEQFGFENHKNYGSWYGIDFDDYDNMNINTFINEDIIVLPQELQYKYFKEYVKNKGKTTPF